MKKTIVILMMVGAIFVYHYYPCKAQSNNLENPPIISTLSELITHTQDWDRNCSDSTIQISYEDAQRLMKIAVAEAGNQGVEGQLRVMQVVWNRVQSPNFPDTVEGVISQSHQFQTYGNGMYQDAEPTPETHEALALFESNKAHDNRIVAFETSSAGRSLEVYFDFLYQLKDHDFFTQKKKNP